MDEYKYFTSGTSSINLILGDGTDEQFTYMAYASMINDTLRNQIKTFYKLSFLTFIPSRPWSGDPKDIDDQIVLKPRPLPLQIELLHRDERFLFQLDERNASGTLSSDTRARQTAWDRTVSVWSKLAKTNTDSNEIINEEIKQLMYSELVQYNEDPIDIVESILDFSLDIIPDVRSYFFLALLKEYLSQTLLGQTNILWRLKQLDLEVEYFLFPMTYHLRSLMKFASPNPITSEFLFENTTRINAKPGLIIADVNDSLESEELIAVPVMRYQRSTGSLYYDPSEEEFCGTFYYFEFGSNIFLVAKWILITNNKIIAAKELGMSIKEVAKLLDVKITEIEKFWEGELVPLEDEYYAYEDELDQSICTLARKESYDIILLKMMNGTNRYVTEILDVRVRKDSFDSLYLVVD